MTCVTCTAAAAASRHQRGSAAGVLGVAEKQRPRLHCLRAAARRTMACLWSSVSPPPHAESSSATVLMFVVDPEEQSQWSISSEDALPSRHMRLCCAGHTCDKTDDTSSASSRVPTQRSLPIQDLGRWRTAADAGGWRAVLKVRLDVLARLAVLHCGGARQALQLGGLVHAVRGTRVCAGTGTQCASVDGSRPLAAGDVLNCELIQDKREAQVSRAVRMTMAPG